MDLQPGRNGHPPSHMADGSGGSEGNRIRSHCRQLGTQAWSESAPLTVCPILWVAQLMTLSLVATIIVSCDLLASSLTLELRAQHQPTPHCMCRWLILSEWRMYGLTSITLQVHFIAHWEGLNILISSLLIDAGPLETVEQTFKILSFYVTVMFR